MTLPDERVRSLKNMGRFCQGILEGTAGPRVSRGLREEAARRLRHYPTEWEIDALESADTTGILKAKERP